MIGNHFNQTNIYMCRCCKVLLKSFLYTKFSCDFFLQYSWLVLWITQQPQVPVSLAHRHDQGVHQRHLQLGTIHGSGVLRIRGWNLKRVKPRKPRSKMLRSITRKLSAPTDPQRCLHEKGHVLTQEHRKQRRCQLIWGLLTKCFSLYTRYRTKYWDLEGDVPLNSTR